MDYSRPALAEKLGAEYALGTLRGRARRRMEALLPAHARLREEVAAWQARLAPLAAAIRPVSPSPSVWAGVERRLFGADAPRAMRWWQRLGLWQGATALATVAAVALALVLAQPRPVAPPIVIVLSANPDAHAQAASFVASVTPDGRALVLRPIDPVQLAAGRSLELWSVPGQGAPRSLGIVNAQGATTVLRAHLLQNTAAFAVSVEPAGGSPTGAPTGPIVSVGKIQS